MFVDRYREPAANTVMQRLHSITVSPALDMKCRQHDVTGSGFIKRSDLTRILTELGFGHSSQANMLAAIKLFESRVDGQVNYGNFIEYLRENGVSLDVEILSRQIYSSITNDGEIPLDDKLVRQCFKSIDVDGYGTFSVERFANFLKSANIPSSNDAAYAVFSGMDDGSGVRLHSFATWLKNIPKSNSSLSVAYSLLSLAELQRKAHAYMLLVSTTGGDAALEELHQSYLVYDWIRPATGFVDKELFINATKRIGFPFTMSELRVLAAEFSDHSPESQGGVNYRK